MNLSVRNILASLVVLHASACMTAEDWSEPDPADPGQPADQDPGGPGPGEGIRPITLTDCNQNLRSGTDGCQMQGRHLLSEVLDDPSYFSVHRTAIDANSDQVTVSLTGGAALQASGPTGTYPDWDDR